MNKADFISWGEFLGSIKYFRHSGEISLDKAKLILKTRADCLTALEKAALIKRVQRDDPSYTVLIISHEDQDVEKLLKKE